ncbi:uncharacterized protein LOC135184710 [Pogoniulus pusillus]|uniref:uncharacterized protein LOC135184710 n=1 Tax=Pogoniulus pusillus TaxID=488313 RepID=UPI0030B94486
MEQLILGTALRHIKDSGVIRSSQHGSTKGKSSLTNLIAFDEDITRWIDDGRAVDVDNLDFANLIKRSKSKVKMLAVPLKKGQHDEGSQTAFQAMENYDTGIRKQNASSSISNPLYLQEKRSKCPEYYDLHCLCKGAKLRVAMHKKARSPLSDCYARKRVSISTPHQRQSWGCWSGTPPAHTHTCAAEGCQHTAAPRPPEAAKAPRSLGACPPLSPQETTWGVAERQHAGCVCPPRSYPVVVDRTGTAARPLRSSGRPVGRKQRSGESAASAPAARKGRSPALAELGASRSPSPGAGRKRAGKRNPRRPEPTLTSALYIPAGRPADGARPAAVTRQQESPAPPLLRPLPGTREGESHRVNPWGGGRNVDVPLVAAAAASHEVEARPPLPLRSRAAAGGRCRYSRRERAPLFAASLRCQERCVAATAALAHLFLWLPGAALRAQRHGHTGPREGAATAAAVASLSFPEPVAVAP